MQSRQLERSFYIIVLAYAMRCCSCYWQLMIAKPSLTESIRKLIQYDFGSRKSHC